MKTCGLCCEQFTDGVQCGNCKKHLDFTCGGISEAGWRKLGSDRRSHWKCPKCRLLSPTATTADAPASLDTILIELRDVKRQLLNLPILVDDLRLIKEELSDLKAASDFSGKKIEELHTRIMDLETRMSDIDSLHGVVNTLQAELTKTKLEQLSHDQRSRLNNVEIKGIPVRSDENLFTLIEGIGKKINYVCPKTQINYISRVPMKNSNEKLIIVNFLNRYVKEDFIAAARSEKHLSTAHIGFQGTPQAIYVNDHLTVEAKILLSKVKTTAKEKNYTYVWVKHGKIHVRKSATSKAFIVRKEADLNKIV